ncbi:chorismate mutase [Paenibacillus sp. y28]|uniref:chorismate mutase n=1 Tax=Paenibacillus sp. y28 TaxID=3129110 RepID=UPI0030192317
MVVRGIRGAITVQHNEETEILQATRDMLHQIVVDNEIKPEDICSVFVTVTQDLDAAFPAKAIRQLPGWELVPLMCSLEIPVAGGLKQCIRLMVHVNTTKSQSEVIHVYMNEAVKLRPDLTQAAN